MQDVMCQPGQGLVVLLVEHRPEREATAKAFGLSRHGEV
jgi:hypothetical protein